MFFLTNAGPIAGKQVQGRSPAEEWGSAWACSDIRPPLGQLQGLGQRVAKNGEALWLDRVWGWAGGGSLLSKA